MGDRREFQDGSLKYFQLLDLFMSTFSREAEGKGLEPPLFHIFSETLVPCPSGETGLFDEFPTWPVELDQVREEAGRWSRWKQKAYFEVYTWYIPALLRPLGIR